MLAPHPRFPVPYRSIALQTSSTWLHFMSDMSTLVSLSAKVAWAQLYATRCRAQGAPRSLVIEAVHPRHASEHVDVSLLVVSCRVTLSSMSLSPFRMLPGPCLHAPAFSSDRSASV